MDWTGTFTVLAYPTYPFASEKASVTLIVPGDVTVQLKPEHERPAVPLVVIVLVGLFIARNAPP